MGKKQLVVHLDSNQVRFVRLVNKEIETEHLFSFNDRTHFGYKDQLDAFLIKTDFRTLDWDDYSLSWFSPKSTLLPFSIFSSTTPADAFRLAFGESKEKETLDFNRLPEWEIVNVFGIPEWVKSFFIARFARMSIQHEGSHLIRGMAAKKSQGLRIHIVQHQDHFSLLAMKNQTLQYYNSFAYQDVEDILYHSAHLIQKKAWMGEKSKWHFSSHIESGVQDFEKLSGFASKMDLFTQATWKNKSEWITEIHELCV
jgi:hypothetical protein